MNFLDLLNNREKATILWILLFFLWVFIRRDTRESAFDVIKALFHRRVISIFIAMAFYVCLLIVVFDKIGIWTSNLTKDTAFWLIATAVVLLINVGKTSHNHDYFKKILRDNLKLILAFEFIFNLYSFSLGVELVLVPLLFIVVGMGVAADTKDEYRVAKKVIDLILGAFGLAIIVFTLNNIFMDFQAFASSDNLHALVLPPLLTITYIPFLYAVGLLMAYENFFIYLDHLLKTDKALAQYAKQRILVLCNLDSRKLNRFRHESIPQLMRSGAMKSETIMNLVREMERQKAVDWRFVWRWFSRTIVWAAVVVLLLAIAYRVLEGGLDKYVIETYGGWIVAIISLVFTSISALRTGRREFEAAPYEQITDWLRRVDAMAYDYYQKASESQPAWESATYAWETTKAEYNWVMGLVRSFEEPFPLYSLLEQHFGHLLTYEALAHGKRNHQESEVKHREAQLTLHSSSGEIYRELRNRRRSIWRGFI
ncbi:MAG: hypothetical protein KJ065_02075 [Anaerolineae bacterium]|nr:hypothetical protein [Anaerolineae bacterium]